MNVRRWLGDLFSALRSGPTAAGKVQPRHSLPEGHRVYAIGDIHGRLDLFTALLAQIDDDDARRAPMKTTLVFIGDLIDRGPQSAGVVAKVRALRAERDVRVIAGNHEEMFLRALEDDDVMRAFLRYGGRETFMSYGLDEAAIRDMTFAELRSAIFEAIPPEDLAFFRSLEAVFCIGDYAFVHAGIRPGLGLEDQSSNDLRWIREPFLSDQRDHGVMVVHGHSITDAPDVQSNRIGIDTGAYLTGRLTALALEGGDRWFLVAYSPEQSS